MKNLRLRDDIMQQNGRRNQQTACKHPNQISNTT